MSTPTYNHMYIIAFTVSGSTRKDGKDVTADTLRQNLYQRIEDLDSEGDLAWLEACGGPEDTYEEQT